MPNPENTMLSENQTPAHVACEGRVPVGLAGLPPGAPLPRGHHCGMHARVLGRT